MTEGSDGHVNAAENRVKKSEELLFEGLKAFRLTREYVGEDTLPAVKGWSWFDWYEKVHRHLMLKKAEAGALVRTPGGHDGVIVIVEGEEAWVRYSDNSHSTWPICELLLL